MKGLPGKRVGGDAHIAPPVRQQIGVFDFNDAKPLELGPMRASAPTV